MVSVKSKLLLIVVLLFSAAGTGLAIADENWLYLGIVFVPVILYFCIHKPFIFPFGLYVFLVPFDAVLSVSGSAEGTTLTKLLGVLVILVLSIKGLVENRFKKPDSATIWWILFVLFGSLTGLWAIKHGGIIHPTLVGLFVLYMVASSYKIKRSEFETLKWCILLGGLVAAAYTIINNQAVVGARVTLGTEERHATLNGFAFSLLFSASICIQTIFKQNNIYRKGMFCFILGVILYCIILTSSRGALLSVGVIFCMYIVFSNEKISYICLLLLVCVALGLLLPAVFLSRWAGTIGIGCSAGSVDIWCV
ncbi:MAG: hypothetical protein GY941_01275, partial [Planctomycetes bacterium]|nr:hypothetical protein [Planctomycetota bacterium]